MSRSPHFPASASLAIALVFTLQWLAPSPFLAAPRPDAALPAALPPITSCGTTQQHRVLLPLTMRNSGATVPPGNAPPGTRRCAFQLAEDTVGAVDLRTVGSDPDGDTLSWTLDQPAHGTAVLDGPTLVYTPAANYNGADAVDYTLSDGRGGTARGSVAITVSPVNDPPAVTLESVPSSGPAPLQVSFTATAVDVEGQTLTYAWSFGDGASGGNSATAAHTYVVAGSYTATVTVSDGAATTQATKTATVAAAPDDSLAVTLSTAPISGTHPLTVHFGTTVAHARGTLTYHWDFGDGSTAGNLAEATHVYTRTGWYTARVTVGDTQATASDTANIQVRPLPGEIPDPGALAPPVDRSVATTLFAATQFLYSGPDALQTGVAPGTIRPEHVAVLRGRVTGGDGAPLPRVTISVLDHPELGQTLTRDDGMFDLVVNGGGQLTVTYAKDGYLPSQRTLEPPWQEYLWAPDVVLIRPDPSVTAVDLRNSTAIQTARGSTIEDQDGTRRATLLFPAGTAATMVVNGQERPLTTPHVRATEYTVGSDGPETMPGILPPQSGYTYAVELSMDEALAAGATDVRFSAPVPFFLENFLDFPVGGDVPAGYYDQAQGKWVAAPDGRVIQVVTAGAAPTLDVDGGGVDGPDKLAALGITAAELARLGQLYTAGATLWRVPLTHFSPWDLNWPYAPTPGAKPPSNPQPQVPNRPKNPRGSDDDCNKQGSIIGCQAQTLGEAVDLVGTPFRLHYESDRVPRPGDNRLEIQLTGATVPAGLKRVVLELTVAGHRIRREFPPTANQSYTFVWEGKDTYGRTLVGAQPVTGRTGYVYDLFYQEPASFERSFAALSGVPITSDSGRREMTLWEDWRSQVGGLDARGVGLGGWTLDVHHLYHPNHSGAQILYQGDGTRRTTGSIGPIIKKVAGSNGIGRGGEGDGGPAIAAKFGTPRDVELGPDGSLYIVDSSNHRVRRVGPDGIISTVAGSGSIGTVSGFGGDGGPATAAKLNFPSGVALGPDGSLYIADGSNHRIRKVGPDGIISTVAGTGTPGFAGDGGPAIAAQLAYPSEVELGPDGSLYIADNYNNRIRRVGPDGIITTVAGSGPGRPADFGGFGGDGGPATSARLSAPLDVAVAADGTMFIADVVNDRVRRVGTDGIITTVAGTGEIGGDSVAGDGASAVAARLRPQALAVGRDGSVFVGDWFTRRLRRIGTDGIITSVAGATVFSTSIDEGGPAGAANLLRLDGLALGPTGDIYLTAPAGGSCECIYRIGAPLPTLSADERAVPSEDGSEVYIFSGEGRHVRTLDGLSGALRYRFAYDAEGCLSAVTDGDGLVTTIQRTDAGPTSITGPFGQRTTLAVDANGFLSAIVNPAGERVALTSSAGGLLQSLTDARGNRHEYTYNAAGLLIRDAGPAGAVTLAKTDLPKGTRVTFTSARGRVTTYEVEYLDNLDVRNVTVEPSGARTEVLLRSDGSRTVTYPDGSTATQTFGPDPRWGMLAPIMTTLVNTTKAGLTSRAAHQRTVVLNDPDDPFSAREITDQVTINNARYSSSVTRNTADQTWTVIRATPAGRTSTAQLDARGRLISVTPAPGIDPVRYAYDAQGRVTSVRQGNQSLDLSYNSLNQVSTRSDTLGRAATYTYDAAGRMTGVTLPGSRTYTFAYDANGNRTSVTLPSGARHDMAYSSLDLPTDYTPPGNAAYRRAYDADRAVAKNTLPDGRTLDWHSDNGGRPIDLTYAEATSAFSYDGTADQLAGVTRTPASGIAHSLTSVYDSFLVTQLTSGGAAQGRYDYTYDANYLPTAMNLSSGADTANVAIGRDLDGLISRYGPFTFGRSGPAGAISQIGDGVLTLSLAYDTLERPATRTSVVNGVPTYRGALTFDGVGRITRKVETIAGTAATFDYTYDEADRLLSVSRNGTQVEQYAYDANGNRTSAKAGATAAQPANYDAQDRLVTRGGVAHSWDAAGFLTRRGADTFVYSTRGELISATAGGQTTTYAYDGWGRRVSQTTPAGTYQYLYGDLDDMFRVTATRDPAGVLTTYFYDEQGLLYALQRGGDRFYVATDHLGTPRVVSSSTGAVVKTLDYDSFGVLLADSNAQWDLPIGFAGGLRDRVTGLVRFGLRDYDPASGRWTARDPILFQSGQGDLYSYVGNDPIAYRDPQGLSTIGYTSYEGYGGGGKIGIGPSGVAVCGEVGLGYGGGLDVNLTEDAAQTGWNEKLEGTVEFGPGVTLGGGIKIDNCGNVTKYGKVKGGPVGYDTADGWGLGKGANKHIQGGFGKVQTKIEAKWAAEGCLRLFSW